MASPLLPFVLAAMSSVAPHRDHHVVGEAIARVVESEAPLFRGDDDRRRTASLVVAIAFREGSLRASVVGDFRGGHPTSFCTMQIHESSGGGPSLNDDPERCIRTGLAIVRASMRVCTEAPLAWYAVGGGRERACASTYGARVSRDRMALARWIYAAAVRSVA